MFFSFTSLISLVLFTPRRKASDLTLKVLLVFWFPQNAWSMVVFRCGRGWCDLVPLVQRLCSWVHWVVKMKLKMATLLARSGTKVLYLGKDEIKTLANWMVGILSPCLYQVRTQSFASITRLLGDWHPLGLNGLQRKFQGYGKETGM